MTVIKSALFTAFIISVLAFASGCRVASEARAPQAQESNEVPVIIQANVDRRPLGALIDPNDPTTWVTTVPGSKLTTRRWQPQARALPSLNHGTC